VVVHRQGRPMRWQVRCVVSSRTSHAGLQERKAFVVSVTSYKASEAETAGVLEEIAENERLCQTSQHSSGLALSHAAAEASACDVNCICRLSLTPWCVSACPQ